MGGGARWRTLFNLSGLGHKQTAHPSPHGGSYPIPPPRARVLLRFDSIPRGLPRVPAPLLLLLLVPLLDWRGAARRGAEIRFLLLSWQREFCGKYAVLFLLQGACGKGGDGGA